MPIILLFDFIFFLIFRFFIKIVITIFGWATRIFFGKLPEKNRGWFYIMMLLSFLWVYCLVAKFFPVLFNIFISYVPGKTFFNFLRKFLYIICVVGIPPGVGAICALVRGVSRSDKKHIFEWLMKGYRYSFVLGCGMAVMLVCTPVIKVKRFLKHITADYMPMGVSGKGNIKIMDEITEALKRSDIIVTKKIPSRFYSLPVKMTNEVVKDLFDYMSDRELYLAGENISIYLNSSDIMIEGKHELVEKAKTAIATCFVENDILLTVSERAREAEHRIQDAYTEWHEGRADDKETFRTLREILNYGPESGIDYDEWALLSVQINAVLNSVLSKKE